MSDEIPGVRVSLDQIWRDTISAHERIQENSHDISDLDKKYEDHEKRLRGVEWKVYSVVGGVLMGFTTAIVLIVRGVIS